jgi:hypothetical protein
MEYLNDGGRGSSPIYHTSAAAVGSPLPGRGGDDLEAAKQRFETAKKWEASASSMLDIAQRDVNCARNEMSEALAHLRALEQGLTKGVELQRQDSNVSRVSYDSGICRTKSPVAFQANDSPSTTNMPHNSPHSSRTGTPIQQSDYSASSQTQEHMSCAVNASFATLMNSSQQWSPSLTVSGSDIPELNGKYTQCGYYDEVPKYVKVTDCEGTQQVSVIYRFKMNETARRWYISLSSPDNGVYFVKAKEGARKPPRKGWVNIATKGVEEKLRVASNI